MEKCEHCVGDGEGDKIECAAFGEPHRSVTRMACFGNKCGQNTSGGTWPEALTMLTYRVPVKVVPVDPSVLASIQAQQKNCRGCGDGPLGGY